METFEFRAVRKAIFPERVTARREVRVYPAAGIAEKTGFTKFESLFFDFLNPNNPLAKSYKSSWSLATESDFFIFRALASFASLISFFSCAWPGSEFNIETSKRKGSIFRMKRRVNGNSNSFSICKLKSNRSLIYVESLRNYNNIGYARQIGCNNNSLTSNRPLSGNSHFVVTLSKVPSHDHEDFPSFGFAPAPALYFCLQVFSSVPMDGINTTYLAWQPVVHR